MFVSYTPWVNSEFTSYFISPRLDLFVEFSSDAFGNIKAETGFENAQVQILYDERSSSDLVTCALVGGEDKGITNERPA